VETNWSEQFPNVFPEWPVRISFNVSPGWHDLVYTLCAKLEQHARRLHGHAPAFKVVQVKQKLGGLRFYGMYQSSAMQKLIDEAEKRSFTICEACGKPGKLRVVGKHGYRTTLCAEHFEQAKIDGPRKTIWGE